MRHSVLALSIVSCLFSGCDPKSDSKSDSTPLNVSNRSLLFTAFDPSASPWQASLLKLDLETKEVSTVLSGESGDAAIFSTGNSLLFFNRTSESQNYRLISPNNGSYWISTQQKFARGSLGDPHDAISVGSDRVLLSHYSEGSLVVMQQSTGAELQTVVADWDLPEGVTLKPEGFLTVSSGGRTFVYVTHQGLSYAGYSVLANGSQQVFVLEVVNGSVEVLDMDPATPKVQGIKLVGSFPVPVHFKERDKLLFVSMCSRITSPESPLPCKPAIEEIDPSTNSSSVVWDLSDSGLFMNGGITPGPNSNTIFVNVEETVDGGTAKRVVRLNLSDKTHSTVHSFAENSGGFWGTFFDDDSQTLYVGDISESSIGRFIVVPENGERSEIALSLTPYSGTFISPLTQ